MKPARLTSLFRARMAAWAWITLLLAVVVGINAPQQLLVSLYKLSLITSAAWVAYWIDRGLFPYARPDCYLVQPFSVGGPCAERMVVAPGQALAFAAAQIRRALIIAAAMIAVAMGA